MTDDLLTKLRTLKLSAMADGMIRQREAPGTGECQGSCRLR
ncbi:hypothetical protein AAH678_28360 [Sodalis endosymbiont of Spalangia cameroni]